VGQADRAFRVADTTHGAQGFVSSTQDLLRIFGVRSDSWSHLTIDTRSAGYNSQTECRRYDRGLIAWQMDVRHITLSP
jgi:hypothetical protein